jgi:hypothetical protein
MGGNMKKIYKRIDTIPNAKKIDINTKPIIQSYTILNNGIRICGKWVEI